VRSVELEDGRRVEANYDFERDWWTVSLEGRSAEGRYLHSPLLVLLDIPKRQVNPREISRIVRDLARLDTPFGGRAQCRCCGYLTIADYGQYEICPVCYWEDDPTTIWEPGDGYAGPNHISLTEGRANFIATGISDGEPKGGAKVRGALPEEYPPSGEGRGATE
jgi:hypothetical protein